MKNVSVTLTRLGSNWSKPCLQAVKDLNILFKISGIRVVLSTTGSQRPNITVKTDVSIKGNAVHGRTSATINDAGQLMKAEISLPPKVTINTPSGVRDAGPGIYEVIAAHEFVHALGDTPHTSHLMAQTMYKVMGDNAAKDKLKGGGIKMPPLKLSPQTITTLKGIWK